MRTLKISNMVSSNGNHVPNQFIIETDKGTYFQSYSTIIAYCEIDTGYTQVYLDRDSWNYSVTTSKYRNQFLGETTKETQKKIDSGEYKLVNLNE